MQRKLSGDTDFLKVFTWTIGVRIKETSLADGTTVCVFGSLLGSKDKIARMIGPKYIAKSKDEILDYLVSDITFGKFLGILLFIGGGVRSAANIGVLVPVYEMPDQEIPGASFRPERIVIPFIMMPHY